MKARKIIFLCSMMLASYGAANAQVRTDISLKERNNSSISVSDFDYNAHDYSAGFGLGSTKMYGDLPYSNPQPVYIGQVSKNIAPRFSIGWEVMIGDLSSRDPYTHMRSFNHFTAFNQNITAEIGTLFSVFDRNYNENPLLYMLSGLYAGVGIGIINNDVKRIADVNVESLPGIYSTSNPPILQNSTAMYIPFNFGYNLHVPRIWKFHGCVLYANFQYNNTLSDYIDGYKMPFKANKKNDIFTVMSVGFRVYVFHSNKIQIEY